MFKFTFKKSLFLLFFLNINYIFADLNFTPLQLSKRAELQKTTTEIKKLYEKRCELLNKGASLRGKRDIDKEFQALDSKTKELLELERKQTEKVEDQYIMVQNELAKLKNNIVLQQKAFQLGDQYQAQQQLDLLNYKINECEELLKILSPQKARLEKI